MADNIVHFDQDTPKIEQAAKVRSVLAVNGETGEVGAVEFELLVNEAGKRTGDAIKVVGNELPTMGEANKRYSVTTGADGLTLTYGSEEFELNANSQVDMFWDGIAETWEVERQTALPVIPVTDEFGDSVTEAATQRLATSIKHEINNLVSDPLTGPFEEKVGFYVSKNGTEVAFTNSKIVDVPVSEQKSYMIVSARFTDDRGIVFQNAQGEVIEGYSGEDLLVGIAGNVSGEPNPNVVLFSPIGAVLMRVSYSNASVSPDIRRVKGLNDIQSESKISSIEQRVSTTEQDVSDIADDIQDIEIDVSSTKNEIRNLVSEPLTGAFVEKLGYYVRKDGVEVAFANSKIVDVPLYPQKLYMIVSARFTDDRGIVFLNSDDEVIEGYSGDDLFVGIKGAAKGEPNPNIALFSPLGTVKARISYSNASIVPDIRRIYGVNDLQMQLQQADEPEINFTAAGPSYLFFINTSNYLGRKEPLMIYLQRFLRNKNEVNINGKPFYDTLTKDDAQSSNIVSENIPIVIKGEGFVEKTFNINRVSVLRNVLQTQFPKVLYIGDSITENRFYNGTYRGAGALWSMAKEIALKNKADNGGNGYDYLCIGINNTCGGQITYNGQTLQMRGHATGYGGWQAPTFLRHPIRMWVTPAGGWDLLGLSTVHGAYTGSLEQKKLIQATPYGVNAPVVSANSYALLRAEGQLSPDLGSWSGSATQIAQVEAWIDGIADESITPMNPYFDINKTGVNRFSISKFLERYKTLENDGVTRLVAGSTAGTLVTNVNANDVCEPTHIILGLGENDRLFHQDYVQITDDILELANEVRTQRPSVSVGICLTDMPGSMFPERTPEYQGKFYQNHHEKKFDLHTELVSRFGTLATQKANGIYYIPTWYCATPLSHSRTILMTDEGRPNGYIQLGNDDYNHPGYYANRTGGTQVYGWVAYTYV